MLNKKQFTISNLFSWFWQPHFTNPSKIDLSKGATVDTWFPRFSKLSLKTLRKVDKKVK